jgi:hypothetical protein
LQCRHVVTAQHPVAVVQKALAEHPTGLDERVPRLRTADPVLSQSAVPLKRSNRGLGALAEGAGGVRARQEP